MSLLQRNFWVFSLLLLCVYGMYSAFHRGNANAWYFKAEFALNDWADKGKITDKSQYAETLDAITRAQSLDPHHPHYAHMMGRISHWGVDMGFEDKDILVDVKHWYLKATELRSLWPDPWIDLARLNNSLNGYTSETKYYLERALASGPYIDLVTVGTLQVLLLNWPVLSGEERTLLFNQFAIATAQPKVLKQALSFSQSIGRENLLCTQLKFNPDYIKQKKSYLFRRYCELPE